MRIEEIMTRDVTVCTPQTSLEEIAQKMVECDCGLIPLVESKGSRKLVGVVTDRDIVARTIAEGQNPIGMMANDVMTTEVISVSIDADIDEAVGMMEEGHIRRLLVVDSDGNCCGIISQADIARHLDAEETADFVREVSEPGAGPATLH